jgi:hypothetical protein
MASAEETVAILPVLCSYPGVVDDALGVAQRPTRVTMGVALGPISNVAVAALQRLLLRKGTHAKALLQCCFLATRMNARGTAAWRAWIATLSEREALNARSARDQLDNDPITIELLRETFPRARTVDRGDNRCARALHPPRCIDRLLRVFARRRERSEAPLERRQCATRIDA